MITSISLNVRRPIGYAYLIYSYSGTTVGLIFPVERICALAQSRGILVIVDGAQVRKLYVNFCSTIF